MHSLILHPDCAPGPVDGLRAALLPTQDGCTIRFVLRGQVERIILPPPSAAERADNLWQTTCCEIFWQKEGVAAYREFNLSPSSRWACYDFDDYRLNPRDGAVEAVAIQCHHTQDELILDAQITTQLPLPAFVGLTAVVEIDDGTLQYWSLAFAKGKPDFHHADCRSLHIGALS